MLKLAIIFLLGELVALFLFRLIRRQFEGKGKSLPDQGVNMSVIKGILERLFMYLGLILGYGVVIVAFGALKLGTCLKDEQSRKISNDYFLIGNLVSMLLVLIYVGVYRYF